MGQTNQLSRFAVTLVLARALAACDHSTVVRDDVRQPGPSIADGRAMTSFQRPWSYAVGDGCITYVARKGGPEVLSLRLDTAELLQSTRASSITTMAASGGALAFFAGTHAVDAGVEQDIAILFDGEDKSTPLAGVDVLALLVSGPAERRGDATSQAGPTARSAADRKSLIAVPRRVQVDGRDDAVVSLLSCNPAECTRAPEELTIKAYLDALSTETGVWLFGETSAAFVDRLEGFAQNHALDVTLGKKALATQQGLVVAAADGTDLLLLQPAGETVTVQSLLRSVEFDSDQALVAAAGSVGCPSAVALRSCLAETDAARSGALPEAEISSFSATVEGTLLVSLSTGCVALLNLQTGQRRLLGRPQLGAQPLQTRIARDGSALVAFSAGLAATYVWTTPRPQDLDGGVVEGDAGASFSDVQGAHICLGSAAHEVHVPPRGLPLLIAHDAPGAPTDQGRRLSLGSGYTLVDPSPPAILPSDGQIGRHTVIDVGVSPSEVVPPLIAVTLYDALHGRHLLHQVAAGGELREHELSHVPLSIIVSQGCGYFGILEDHPDGLLSSFSWTSGAPRVCEAFDLQARVTEAAGSAPAASAGTRILTTHLSDASCGSPP